MNAVLFSKLYPKLKENDEIPEITRRPNPNFTGRGGDESNNFIWEFDGREYNSQTQAQNMRQARIIQQQDPDKPLGAAITQADNERLEAGRQMAQVSQQQLEQDINKAMTQMLIGAGVIVAGGVGLAAVGGVGGLAAGITKLITKFGITLTSKLTLNNFLKEIMNLIGNFFNQATKQLGGGGNNQDQNLQFDLRSIIQKANTSENEYAQSIINTLEVLSKQPLQTKESKFEQIYRLNEDWWNQERTPEEIEHERNLWLGQRHAEIPMGTISQGDVNITMPDGQVIRTNDSNQIQQLSSQGGQVTAAPRQRQLNDFNPFDRQNNIHNVFSNNSRVERREAFFDTINNGLDKAADAGLLTAGAVMSLKQMMNDGNNSENEQLKMRLQKIENGLNANLQFDLRNLLQKAKSSNSEYAQNIVQTVETLVRSANDNSQNEIGGGIN